MHILTRKRRQVNIFRKSMFFKIKLPNRRTDNGYTKAKEEAGLHNSEARGGSEEALGGSGEASRNNNSI